MNKKVLIFITLVVVIGITAFILLRGKSATPVTSSPREDALNQARQYEPPAGTLCTQAITPAVHPPTGARYTFTNGCLPPGWRAER